MGVGLKGLRQGTAISLLQIHLSLHHHPGGYFHPVLCDQILLDETLLPRHSSLWNPNKGNVGLWSSPRPWHLGHAQDRVWMCHSKVNGPVKLTCSACAWVAFLQLMFLPTNMSVKTRKKYNIHLWKRHICFIPFLPHCLTLNQTKVFQKIVIFAKVRSSGFLPTSLSQWFAIA